MGSIKKIGQRKPKRDTKMEERIARIAQRNREPDVVARTSTVRFTEDGMALYCESRLETLDRSVLQ